MASIYNQALSLPRLTMYHASCKPKLNRITLSVMISSGGDVNTKFATKVGTKKEEELYRNRVSVPKEKQLVDHHRQGKFVEEGEAVYRQTVVIRSNEVDYKKTATMEAILNLMQEASTNHGWLSGLNGDGFVATRAMQKHNLIWVVTRMKVDVDLYPIWGEVIEIDTWLGTTGKIGITRDWIIRSHETKEVYARARCTYVMMNQISRRLSKLPEEVRDELSPCFVQREITKDDVEKIHKLENNAKYISPKFQPKISDLDVNQHVNSVKYAKWMLEVIPESKVDNYIISSITLEYRRECEVTEKVESLCDPEEYDIVGEPKEQFPNTMEDSAHHNSNTDSSLRFTHLLKGTGDKKNEEIKYFKEEDYFTKNNELSTWLKEEWNVYIRVCR
ncbi:hypothetical protein ACFE04_005108 [Oxalis oulophora]